MTLDEIKAIKDLIPEKAYRKIVALHFTHGVMFSVIHQNDLYEEYQNKYKKRIENLKRVKNETSSNIQKTSNAEGSKPSE